MKIIGVDNFGRETKDDFLVEANVTKEYGESKVKELNENEKEGDYSPNFFKLVEDDYVLYKWEP
jgi:hypothetical protein